MRSEGTVDLGFLKRATIYSLKLIKQDASRATEWTCLNGKAWEGTKLRFHLVEHKAQTLLAFTHADWENETDYFVACSATRGALMFRIKAVAEGDPRGPLFSKGGWSL